MQTTMTIVAPAGQQAQNQSLVELGKNLLAASRDGYADEVTALLAKGAPMTTDWLGTSPLHLAALNGHHDIAEILMRSGCSKDARTKVDKTPLHLAATEGHATLVEVLLRTGAEVDSKDMLKMTPLHWAVQRGFEECVEALLRYGADVNIDNKFGKTPFEVASGINRQDLIELLQNADHIRATLTIDPSESDPLTAAATQSITEDLQSQNDLDQLASSISTEVVEQAPNNQDEAVKLLASHGITYLPEDDESNITLSSDQTLKLTKAGELALNKISVQNIVTTALPTISSNAKVISTGGKQINQPVKIITLNSSKASSNVGKIQSKPIVINAPYVIPQVNRSSALKIQSEAGEKKGPKIIRLTPQQFADLKSGQGKLQGLHSGSASVVTTKQSQPIFLKSDGGIIQQKLNTSQSNSIQTIQQHGLPTTIGGKTVKIVRLNPNAVSGQSQTLSATIVPSPLKKGVVSIAPKIVKTEASEPINAIPVTTSMEEVEEDSSTTSDSNGTEDPKDALRKKLKEIEDMNAELARKQEEAKRQAEELRRQLEKCT